MTFIEDDDDISSTVLTAIMGIKILLPRFKMYLRK